MDYRHHATDVLAGGILGALVASLAYALYYPNLSHPDSHLPHLPVDPAAPLASEGRRFASSEAGHEQELPTVGYSLREGISRDEEGAGAGAGAAVAKGAGGGYARVETGRRSVENTV